MGGCADKKITPRFSASFYHDGVFESKMDDQKMGVGDMISIMWQVFVKKIDGAVPEDGTIPVKKLSTDDLMQMPEGSVVRLGHSTLLFRLDGRFVLTDPVFSDRASPLSFIGPKRFHAMPLAPEALPFIDVMIISHDHYDHLDKTTIAILKDKIGHCYTTIGVKNRLSDFGLDPEKITELDWWESAQNGTLTVTATPAQHFSGRGMFDRNKTLWASWVIKASGANLFFGADSGYFDGFKTIGEKFGPFDMTFLEAGAYNERWRSIHMMPEETVQAHRDLGGAVLFPVHNGTFNLAMHPWREPFERVSLEAERQGVRLTHPLMGEIISLKNPSPTPRWWEAL